jgi:thermopsin
LDAAANQGGNAFTLKRGDYRTVKLSIPETSYLTYSTKSNASISTTLATPGQIQKSNRTWGIADAIFDQNGTSSRNAALLTYGDYYLAFYAYQSAAEVTYSYKISAANLRNATTYFGETVVLQPRHTYSIHVNYETLGSPSTLTLFGISNRSVYYTIYDSSSSSITFRSPLVTATNATGENGVAKDAYKLKLAPAMYAVHVTNPHPAACLLRVEYNLSPSYVNPYLAIIGRGLTGYPKFLATGLSSFGLYNQSGEITPYEVRTNRLIGFANISSISAYNPKPPVGVGRAAASLQLNAVLVIKNIDGSRYEYWVQNVFGFQTDSKTVHAFVSVVNVTGLAAYLNDQTI